MNNKIQEAIEAIKQDVMAAAEQKLERSLTEAERQGILSLSSLMMLDSCYQSFSSPACTQARVLANLEHFTKLAQ